MPRSARCVWEYTREIAVARPRTEKLDGHTQHTETLQRQGGVGLEENGRKRKLVVRRSDLPQSRQRRLRNTLNNNNIILYRARRYVAITTPVIKYILEGNASSVGSRKLIYTRQSVKRIKKKKRGKKITADFFFLRGAGHNTYVCDIYICVCVYLVYILC